MVKKEVLIALGVAAAGAVGLYILTREKVPPGEKWCAFEDKYIPEEEWTEERCEPRLIPPIKWCEKEGKTIYHIKQCDIAVGAKR